MYSHFPIRQPPYPSPHSLPKTAIAFSHRVCMLYNALRGVRFHTLQITKSAPPDALRLRGLCRTSRRFNNWISEVIITDIDF